MKFIQDFIYCNSVLQGIVIVHKNFATIYLPFKVALPIKKKLIFKTPKETENQWLFLTSNFPTLPNFNQFVKFSLGKAMVFLNMTKSNLKIYLNYFFICFVTGSFILFVTDLSTSLAFFDSKWSFINPFQEWMNYLFPVGITYFCTRSLLANKYK